MTDKLLDPDRITANLKTSRIGKKVLVYESTSSTNDVAAEYSKNRKNDGLAIFAEQQTSGRGRGGNQWYSSRADSILCSIVLTENRLPAELLSLACAVAVADAVGKPARIKWPNDIMLNGRKVAGILLESRQTTWHGLPARDIQQRVAASQPKASGMVEYVVGIGINCHQRKDSFPDELRPAATSIDIETHSVTDRISLARRLLISIDDWIEAAQANPDKVIEQWRNLSIQLGHRVKLTYNGRQFAGNCIGIDPERGLILQLDIGGVRMFDAVHSAVVR